MSLSAMVWAWQIPNLKTTEKIVLLCLADAANHENKCWPSQAHIAAKCSLKRQTVNKTLSALADKKLIGVEHRVSVRGQSSNIYFLAVSRGVTLNDTPVTDDDTPCHPNGHPLSSTMTPPVIQDDTEPSNEPPSEPKKDSPPIVPPEGETKKRKTRIPDDFELDDKKTEVALRHGIMDPIAEFEHFKNHHAGRGTLWVDWDRCWVTWCCGSKKFNSNGAPRGSPVINGGGTVFDKLRRKFEDEENDGRLF